jgi:hypothetical protein
VAVEDPRQERPTGRADPDPWDEAEEGATARAVRPAPPAAPDEPDEWDEAEEGATARAVRPPPPAIPDEPDEWDEAEEGATAPALGRRRREPDDPEALGPGDL